MSQSKTLAKQRLLVVGINNTPTFQQRLTAICVSLFSCHQMQAKKPSSCFVLVIRQPVPMKTVQNRRFQSRGRARHRYCCT